MKDLLLIFGAFRTAYLLNRLSREALFMPFPNPEQFDSNDLPGSRVNMQPSTLEMLAKAEQIAGFNFHYNSAYRTPEHNATVPGALPDSSHIYGYGVDIHANGVVQQKKIAKALVLAGFNRIGIYSTHLHTDNDPERPAPAHWAGEGIAPFNPFTL